MRIQQRCIKMTNKTTLRKTTKSQKKCHLFRLKGEKKMKGWFHIQKWHNHPQWRKWKKENLEKKKKKA